MHRIQTIKTFSRAQNQRILLARDETPRAMVSRLRWLRSIHIDVRGLQNFVVLGSVPDSLSRSSVRCFASVFNEEVRALQRLAWLFLGRICEHSTQPTRTSTRI